MKPYVKLLLLTLGIQAASLGIETLLYQYSESVILWHLSAWLLFLSFPAAVALDILLALRWGRSKKEILICIFGMPTNYAAPVFVIWAFQKFMAFVNSF